ncbi:MAG: toll/interleukin-1 receptor domain-containing protein [Planctomycetes bacterium]|nr:toll/interleukin-1 receptor domain-containing protein [Planctomycetota bacterium]
MTRDEALKLLRGGVAGVAEWNRRRANGEEIPSFVNADLTHANLAGANLSDARLEDACLAAADLESANLEDADLTRAYLREAILSHSNLSHAQLTNAMLYAADISDANLNGANLNEANLDDANLSNADLSVAELRRASLHNVDLKGANLRRSNLRGADFRHGDLCNANLSGASLLGASLFGAELEGADFSQAQFVGTNLGATDLSHAIHLETADHIGPSTIGTDTLTLSKGRIPEEFLRGCGLTPWEVIAARIYDPDLTALQIADIQAESFHERTKGPIFLGGVFVSYSHDDAKFVDKLYARLKKEGSNVWLDRHDATAGPLRRQVVDNIRLHDIVLLVLSESSVNSNWVDYELKKALQKEVDEKRDVLCPVALDDAWKEKTKGKDHWCEVREKNVLDFSKWKTKAFDGVFCKLVDGLKKYYPPST